MYGHAFSSSLVQLIWEKAEPVAGEDPRYIRKDLCGAIIRRERFGECTEALSEGWVIDHIKPVSKGGTDDYANLQPLQWENNQHKGEAHPSWDCLVSVSGTTNAYIKQEAFR
jgi:5-methylcytosine-specific restriction endonuclease McrA